MNKRDIPIVRENDAIDPGKKINELERDGAGIEAL
jgi:hypothetical protein